MNVNRTRALKALIFLGVFGLFMLAVASGFFFIISGGDPINFARTALIRLELVNRQDELNTPIGTDATPRRFIINSGDAALTVASNLVNTGLITDARLFLDYVRVNELDVQLEAGVYFLNQTQNIPTIATLLTDASSSHIRFLLPDGYRIEEVATLIDQTPQLTFTGQDFLAVVGQGATIPASFQQTMQIPEGASLEGFLMPDAYILPPQVDALTLRDVLLENFEQSIGQQLINDANAQGLSVYDVVTFASIIEREAVWHDEHPLIASVYRNRYTIGMRLEADPTVQYALNGTRGSWWPRITQADYRNVTGAHNTYLNTGLPPSPIASPSLSAIRAATYPLQTEYYFFRARCDGSNYHNFATTYDEHLANGCR